MFSDKLNKKGTVTQEVHFPPSKREKKKKGDRFEQLSHCFPKKAALLLNGNVMPYDKSFV